MKDTHLTVEVSEHHARFNKFVDGEIIIDLKIHFNSSNIDDIREKLYVTYKDNSFLNEVYDESTLSWAGLKSTLVPFSIFGESNPGAIFNLCFSQVSSDHSIDYNRISELGIVNVYEIPDWVKSWFVIKHPRVIVQHTGSNLLRKALNSDAFKLKILVVLYDNFFQVIISKHNQLQYYSTFNYQNEDDVLYYVLFTLQQKELTSEPGKILLIDGVGSTDEMLIKVQDKLGKIVDLKKLSIDRPVAYIAKSHELCV